MNSLTIRRSVKSECLSRLILFGERSPRRAVTEYLEHYHYERSHQGKVNLLLFATSGQHRYQARAAIRCRERIGGLLKYYRPCRMRILTIRARQTRETYCCRRVPRSCDSGFGYE